jgi:hypothetical protein
MVGWFWSSIRYVACLLFYNYGTYSNHPRAEETITQGTTAQTIGGGDGDSELAARSIRRRIMQQGQCGR